MCIWLIVSFNSWFHLWSNHHHFAEVFTSFSAPLHVITLWLVRVCIMSLTIWCIINNLNLRSILSISGFWYTNNNCLSFLFACVFFCVLLLCVSIASIFRFFFFFFFFLSFSIFDYLSFFLFQFHHAKHFRNASGKKNTFCATTFDLMWH